MPHLCKPDNGVHFLAFILRPGFERLPGKPLASCGSILSFLACQFPGSAGNYSMRQVLLDAFTCLLTGGLASATFEAILQLDLPPKIGHPQALHFIPKKIKNRSNDRRSTKILKTST